MFTECQKSSWNTKKGIKAIHFILIEVITANMLFTPSLKFRTCNALADVYPGQLYWFVPSVCCYVAGKTVQYKAILHKLIVNS
jgi:hypothetical protein